jgi:hypothetical protein
MIATAHHASPAKLALLASVLLTPGHWDAQAQAWSRLIPHDWPGDYVDHWTKLIAARKAEVFDVLEPVQKVADNAGNFDTRRVGVVIVTVCHDFPTPELIVLGAYSKESRMPLTLDAMPQIENIARFKGCATIRFHTMRPGLVSKALLSGFTVSEVVMRKDVPDGV